MLQVTTLVDGHWADNLYFMSRWMSSLLYYYYYYYYYCYPFLSVVLFIYTRLPVLYVTCCQHVYWSVCACVRACVCVCVTVYVYKGLGGHICNNGRAVCKDLDSRPTYDWWNVFPVVKFLSPPNLTSVLSVSLI